MNRYLILNKRCVLLVCLLVGIGCAKPASEQPKDSSPAKPAAQPSPASSSGDMEAGAAMLRILNAAHRSGGIMLRGVLSHANPGDL
jgi:hypothetical protein